METNDVCMRGPAVDNIEGRERKNMLKKKYRQLKCKISKRSNDTWSERENVEFKRMSKIEQIKYLYFREKQSYYSTKLETNI